MGEGECVNECHRSLVAREKFPQETGIVKLKM
jgi:hypothetical protein